MKILIYRSRLLAGSETFIADHYDALEKSGVECTFACEEAVGDSIDRFRHLKNRDAHGGKFARLMQKTLFNLAPNWSRLAAEIRTHAPDVIHAHFATDAAEILPIAERLGIPLIVTLHGFDVTSKASYFAKKLPFKWPYVLRAGRLRQRAAAFLPVSDFLRNTAISKGYPAERTHTHYLGTDLDRAPAVSSEPRKNILFVGRLVEKKGCHYLIAAFRKMVANGFEGKLLIIGSGPQMEPLMRSSEDLQERIEFLGAQDRATVLKHMSSASAFCMPSMPAKSGDNEGLGMVYLEAQLAGCPVVAFDQGPVREALSPTNAGYLAEPGNIDDLARNIFSAANESNAKDEKSRSYVTDKFNLTTRTAILVKHYKDIAKKNNLGTTTC